MKVARRRSFHFRRADSNGQILSINFFTIAKRLMHSCLDLALVGVLDKTTRRFDSPSLSPRIIFRSSSTEYGWRILPQSSDHKTAQNIRDENPDYISHYTDYVFICQHRKLAPSGLSRAQKRFFPVPRRAALSCMQ